MTSPADTARLQSIYARESASLLLYVRQAALWAGRDKVALAAVNRVGDEAAATTDAFAAFLADQRIPPPEAGLFPMRYTDLNFTAVRSVLPKLVTELREQVAALEADHAALDGAGAKAAARAVLDSHRKHLGELEAIT